MSNLKELMKVNARLEVYKRAVNRMDDYLEYRYKTDTIEGIRNKMLANFDSITRGLKEIEEKYK